MIVTKNLEKDELALDKLTNRFFDLFTNTDGVIPKVKDIKNIFIEEGIIINNTSGKPIVYGLQDFIKPREEILNNGTLTDFSEYELSHETKIFQNIAQRFCSYKKSGKLNGNYFEGVGSKVIQFIKVDSEWKMTSVTWSDLE